MTSLVDNTPPPTATEPRIAFRQPVDRTGSIDAAWWPRSRNLAAELPQLFEVFWTAGRDMSRVSYNLDAWEPAARRMYLAGRLVHVSGYHYGNPHTLTMAAGRQSDTADLLVIPFDTDAEVAERLLAIAAETGNTLTAQQMIAQAGS